MIVYEALKSEFVEQVINDEIEDRIYSRYKMKIGNVTLNERRSWKNSMQYMYKVLNSKNIPSDAGIAIELNIPSTSKRVDFILSGLDEENKESAIIIELKQWEHVEKVEGKDGIVRTLLNKGLHETTHPSYQAWSYASMIEDYNETVQLDQIKLFPCAYLHNYKVAPVDPLLDDMYKEYIEKAPIYASGDVIRLREFITKYIKYGDNKSILYKIENGKLRPSKSLQDSLLSMLKGNREFIMIDDQKEVYEQALVMARKSYKDGEKRVLIVKGGPGTGKSVLAINLLVNLTKEDMVCQYVSKNSAPRNVYSTKLKGSIKKTNIDNLFKGSGVYTNSEKNEIDVLIIDEAHRLNKKSGMFKNRGENQIKEIINATKFSVFYIDEFQRIDIFDAGKVEEIIKYAKLQKAEYVVMDLSSQFRCNGSDGYISWLDDILQIKETTNFDGFNGDYEFEIVDDPNLLREMIFKKNLKDNKARLLAGYCWDWEKEGRGVSNKHDIVIEEFDFSMSWNLNNTFTWAIDPKSVNEVGCIHTSQGLEFDYVGVIIGLDMRYENGKILTDFNKRAKTDNSLKGIKKMYKENSDKAEMMAEEIIKNTYRTLMTRGQKGCYVYCEDKALLDFIKLRLEMTRDAFEYTENLVAQKENKYLIQK